MLQVQLVCAQLMCEKNTSKDCDRRDNYNNNEIFEVRIKHYITLRKIYIIKIAITVSITISQNLIHSLQLRCGQ